MAKLHEILAVEQSLAETANRLTKETSKTLLEKRTIFSGMNKINVLFNEDDKAREKAPENVAVQYTVDEKLDFLGNELSRLWDCVLQKEDANQRAKANIIVDGQTIAEDIPAIVLLGMEKKLESLLGVYNNIPTLDSAVAWEIAEGYEKSNVFQTKYPEERFQTETSQEVIITVPATERHPAQTATQTKTETVGKYITTNFSGCISSAEKAARIQRLTNLLRAVKQARQRANDVEVTNDLSFGAALINYVNKGL